MPSISFSGTIARPVHEVFALVTDPATHPRWQKNVIESSIVSETAEHVGSVVREVRQFMGRRVETTYRVTVFEADRLFRTESVSGPVPGEVGADFEALEGGKTQLTLHATFHLGGAFKLAGPIANRMMRGEMEDNFKALKALMEA